MSGFFLNLKRIITPFQRNQPELLGVSEQETVYETKYNIESMSIWAYGRERVKASGRRYGIKVGASPMIWGPVGVIKSLLGGSGMDVEC